MHTHRSNRRNGFVLIEALIALLLISVGLLVVSKLQVLSLSGAGEAKSYSRAMALSQKKMEELRNVLIYSQFTGVGALLSGGNATVSDSAFNDNATYAMVWTVEAWPAAPAMPEQQVLRITTTWDDRYGQTKTLDLNSVIAWDDPGAQVKSASASALPQLISPTGDAVRGTGDRDLANLPSGTTLLPPNPDGSRTFINGNTTELLSNTGKILLVLPPNKIGDRQDFTTISGKVYFDQVAPNNKIPSSANVRLRLSSEGECIFNNASLLPGGNDVVDAGTNKYKYFLYTCYVGTGWYGNVGVVVNESGAGSGFNVCVGDPGYNNGTSDNTLISPHPWTSATRTYRGFKAAPASMASLTPPVFFLSTGMGAGTTYGSRVPMFADVSPPPAAGSNGFPQPSTYQPTYYSGATGARNFFDQNFLITSLSGSDTCKTKMQGSGSVYPFKQNSGKYFCIAPDKEILVDDACPSIWPNHGSEVGSGNGLVLTVIPTGTGSGTVTSGPPSGINCGHTCLASFAPATSITLTATFANGSTFTGFTGGTCSTSPCTFPLNSATTIYANFTSVVTDSLTVVLGGSGTGSVTSSPTGIDCGATCYFAFSPGNVTLTAIPTGGSTVNWSVAGCTGLTCTVTVSGPTTATTTFTAPLSYAVTATKVGAGTGRVTSNPTGIDCGAACNSSFSNFAAMSTVTLNASATLGSSFMGWSGACTGAATCVIPSLAGPSTATATFGLNQSCGTTIGGSAVDQHGTVTVTPSTATAGGICKLQSGGSSNLETCTVTVPQDTQVTFRNQRSVIGNPNYYCKIITTVADCANQTLIFSGAPNCP